MSERIYLFIKCSKYSPLLSMHSCIRTSHLLKSAGPICDLFFTGPLPSVVWNFFGQSAKSNSTQWNRSDTHFEEQNLAIPVSIKVSTGLEKYLS